MEKHILLVEDNEGDILLIREAFQASQVPNSVSVVKDGKEAINFLSKEGKYEEAMLPDLVLLDINLPKINGHEVLKYIRNHDDLRHLPVVIFTTSMIKEDIAASYTNHVNCFIAKPFELDEFFKVVSIIDDFWLSVVVLPSPRA